MQMKDFLPADHLQPFVKTYRVIECQDEKINTVLPGTSLALAFRFKGEIAYLNESGPEALPSITFSGLRKTVRKIRYAPKSSAIIALFRETGISAFFSHPIHKLFEKSLPLELFFPSSEIRMIEEQLSGSTDIKEIIAVIDNFLTKKLISNRRDSLIEEAIARIRMAHGNIRIKSLASELFISQDAFEKRFRKIVGSTPKQYASIERMQSIIRYVRQGGNINKLAFDAGYFDRPHFNKDFKLFTGQTPTAFFKSPSFW